MSLDSLIAVAALLIAAYQIIPRTRQLELKLRFRPLDLLLVLLAFVTVLYLQFYPTFQSLGLAPSLGLRRWGLTPQNVSFLVILGTGLLLLYRTWRFRLRFGDIGRFSALVAELLERREYPTLIHVLSRHWSQIQGLAKRGTPFLRLHDSLKPDLSSPFEDFVRDLSEKEGHSSKEKTPKGLKALAAKSTKELRLRLFALLESSLGRSIRLRSSLASSVGRLLRDQTLAREVALNRPGLGLRMLETEHHEVHSFIEVYFRSLIFEPASSLYRELNDTSNFSSGEHFHLPDESRVLKYLFDDASRAEELAVYSPIGDSVIRELDKHRSDPESDPGNSRVPHKFQELERKTSPLFIGLKFFDVMITRSLEQGIQWHMWLYYLPIFLEKALRQYRPLPQSPSPWESDKTIYDEFIEEIFWMLEAWVSSVTRLDLSREGVRLQSTSADHENDNLVKSSMLALGLCIRHLWNSQNVTQAKKDDLATGTLRKVLELRRSPELKQYSAALLNSVLAGGFGSPWKEDRSYLSWLLGLANSVELMPLDTENGNWMRDTIEHAEATA